MNQVPTVPTDVKGFTVRFARDLDKRLALTAVHLETTKQALVTAAVEAYLNRKTIERQITEEETHG